MAVGVALAVGAVRLLLTLAPSSLPRLDSPGLFAALGTRVLAGRDLTWTDDHEGRQVVLVSANLAREYWGSPQAAIGRRLRHGDRQVSFSPWSEVDASTVPPVEALAAD